MRFLPAAAASGRPGARHVVAGLLAGLAMAALQATAMGQRMEHGIGLSWLYVLRGSLPPPEGAVVLALDDDGAEWVGFHADDPGRVSARLGGCLTEADRAALRGLVNAMTIPRSLQACVLDALVAAGARVAVFDVVFRREGDPAVDARFAAAIRRARAAGMAVVLLEGVDRQAGGLVRRERPSARFREAATATGMFRVGTDRTGLVVEIEDRLDAFPDLASLPGRALEAYRGAPDRLPAAATAGHPAALPWFYGPPGALPMLNLRALFEDDAAGRRARDALAGRAVFVGLADPSRVGEKDHFRVVGAGGDADAMPGVEIVATVFLNRLEGRQLMPVHALLTPVKARPDLALTFALGLIGCLALAGRSGWQAALTVGGLLVAVIAVSAFLFVKLAVWWPVSVASGGLALIAMTSALQGYARTRASLSLRLPGPVARAVERGDGRGLLAPKSMQATVLFVDVAGSTGLAERLGAPAYARVLIGFQRAASAAVESETGVVVEIEGDGLLAAFPAEGGMAGPPEARACRAARAIAAAAAAAPLEPGGLAVRIGIAHGDVLMGEFEAGGRLGLRVIGDPVNAAGRLQGLAREIAPAGGSAVMVSETVRVGAASRLGTGAFLPAGRAVLKGRQHETKLSRLVLCDANVVDRPGRAG